MPQPKRRTATTCCRSCSATSWSARVDLKADRQRGVAAGAGRRSASWACPPTTWCRRLAAELRGDGRLAGARACRGGHARRPGLHHFGRGRASLRSPVMSEPPVAPLDDVPPAVPELVRDQMPRWVWQAVAIFWLGFLATVAARSTVRPAQRPADPAAGVAVPVAGHRARRQPARSPRLAPRHGDRRHPVRRADGRSSSSSSRSARWSASQIAELLGQLRVLRQPRRRLPQRHLRHQHRPGRRHRRDPTIPTAASSSSSPSQGDDALRVSLTALGVRVPGPVGPAVHLLPRGRRAAPASLDLQPPAPGAAACRSSARGSWRSTRPAATCTRGRCSPACRRCSTGSCSRRSARRRRSPWRCGSG